ncbi:hypothetical protein CONPUDRAFT_157365 [Coniophora puteana RWD-64-598 SS2]|uniref:DNA breaking-rejoining enzyme n=1 Tax=Coniophora puteana (strain RWD-64-598) TaxID=741705 RepID=A0A5M3MDZ0_CONPW|nr:uncharacterized protein CONPUDRAFT_157365 [Coniophora puteana RWD-64-598 SS2]EIW77100.1 hypothetical protein CONPUDRAFT_157365 [Coniophora puteana RWD-64-598 SS2]
MTPLSLSSASSARVQLALDTVWASSTRNKYAAGVAIFHSFCDSEHIPDASRLPAAEHLLCAFAASRIGSIAGSTVRGYIAALKAWHIYYDAHWYGGARLNLVLHGVENMTPTSSRRAPRPPITRDMLLLLADQLDPLAPSDSVVLSAASVAFYGQCCLGEILSDWEDSFRVGHTALFSHLSDPLNNNRSRKLFLPFTKVSKSRGEHVYICRQSDRSDPVAALEAHLLLNSPPASVPLFSFKVGSGGRWKCLTKRRLLLRCNAIWTAHGYSSSSGHAFRIGGTTELLLAGVPPDVVKTMGRWSSDAFLRYWRSLDILAPLHAERLPSAHAARRAHSPSICLPRA